MFAKKFKSLLFFLFFSITIFIQSAVIEESPDQINPFLESPKTVLVEKKKRPFLKRKKSFLPKPAFILKGGKGGLLPELEISAIKSNISLSIFKNLSFSFSNKVYPNDPNRAATYQPNLNQSMKLNLKGIVGDRLNILIKYDDTQKTFNIDQNISLKYIGKKDEILSYLEAGNINLSLPNTQFVSYNKNFFGIKGKLIFEDIPIIPGKLQLFPIIGVSENKTTSATYSGNTSNTKKTISDCGYAKNSVFVLYRNVPEGTHSKYAYNDLINNFLGDYKVIGNSEVIYYDNRIGTDNTEATVAAGPKQGETQIWNFDQLLRGTDYYIDTVSGLLYLQKSIKDNGLLIGAFQVQNNTTAEIIDIGNNLTPFIDDNDSGFFDDDPAPGMDNDNDGDTREDTIDGIDNDGDGQIDEDPDDIWIDGGSAQTGTDPYQSGYIFLKAEQNRYMGNALVNVYKTGITGISPGDVTVNIINKNDPDGDNDPTVFTTSSGKKISYLAIFGLDMEPIDGRIDIRFLDTDNGYLIFSDATPFDLTDNDTSSSSYFEKLRLEKGLDDTDINEIIEKCSNKYIYAVNDSLIDPFNISQTKFDISLEYAAPQKSYNLHWDIKEGSEVVKVDGIITRRGTDYTIDYNTGNLTFINEEILRGNAKVEIAYEYVPFGVTEQKYVLGNRFEWNVSKNFFIGSTIISERFLKKQTEIPKPGDEPESKFVFDVDGSLNITKDFLKRTLFSLPILKKSEPYDIKLSGEYAYSYNNPNTYKKTAIETMEATKTTESPSTSYKLWNLSSKPAVLSSADTRAKTTKIQFKDIDDFNNFGEFGFYSCKDDDSHPYTPSEEEGLQSGHIEDSLFFKLSKGNSWAGIQNVFSTNFIDMSRKTSLDFWIKNLKSLPKNAIIHIDIGLISEDSDGDIFLDTEDTNSNGSLNLDEDTGITFDYDTATTSILGKDDGSLQSEDLDKDGLLDTAERYYTYTSDILNSISEGDGWQFVSIPLNLENDEKQGNPSPNNVKYVRIWIENLAVNDLYFKIQNFSLSGNNWEKGIVENGIAPEYLSISAISMDDPNFSRFFDSDEKSDREALCLDFLIDGTAANTKTAYTKLVSQRGINISNYNNVEISTLGYEMPQDTAVYTLYLKMGIDENNYWRIPLSIKKGVDISQWVVNKMNIKNIAQYEKTGNPSLLNVKYLSLEIITGSSIQGKFFINNIILTDPDILKDSAYRASISTTLPGIGPISVNYSNIGGRFSALGSSRTGSNVRGFASSLTVNTLKWLPVSLGYTNTTSTLRDILQLSQSSSNYQTKNESFRMSTSLNLGRYIWKYLPSISYSYSNGTNAGYALEDNHSVERSKSINEVHTISLKLTRLLFLLENLNISSGKNVNLSKYNKHYDSTKENSSTIRNNISLNFKIRFFNIQNSFLYNNSILNGFKQNDALTYNLSTNISILKSVIEPRISLKASLGRLYYKDTLSEDVDATNVKFGTTASITNRLSLRSLLRNLHLLSLNTINLNGSYTKTNSSNITAYEGIFPIKNSLDILRKKFDKEIYANLTDQQKINISLSYIPISFMNFSGSYNYLIMDTVISGTEVVDTTHTISSNLTLTKLDKLFKFLKKTSLLIGFQYSLNEKSGSDYITETYTPSLSFPINFSPKLNQSFRLSYSKKVNTRFDIDKTTSNTLTFSSNWNYRLDLKYGIKLPFLKNKIKASSPINTKLGISYSILRSDQINTTESNSLNVNGGFDYRFSKNFVFNSNLSYSLYKNITERRLDYREFKFTIGGNIVF